MNRIATFSLACVLVLLPDAYARATVVINELMYHPASVYERREFLELHNTGTTPVDLSGWCVDGIGFCFPAGASIPAGGYRVLAADAAQFQSAYGFAPDNVYPGQLSNTGEPLQLLDASGTVVDEVEYDDQGDWPPTADGQGSSLERIDPNLGGNSPRNWHASTAAAKHTARAVNSVRANSLPPWISEVAYPIDLQPAEPMPVTARVQEATTVSLSYVLDFGAEVPVPMYDDGAHGDGAAGDGIFGVTIPGQAAGKMIRFKIVATGPTGQMQHPRDDDTIRYVGALVADPALSSPLPIFHWMIDPVDYQQALDHRYTDVMEPAVLIYNGKLYDNIQIRVRGQTSRSWPKPNWKFKFPQGHDFYDPALILVPADNFDLQSHYSDKAYCREILAHETFRDAGVPASQAFHVRVQQNGQFFGLFTYLEDLDEDLVTRWGLDEEGVRYKAYDDCRDRLAVVNLPYYYEKESRLDEDFMDLYTFLYGINNLTGQARTNFIYDNVDVPGMVNYLAANLIMHNNDQPAKNYTLYRDTLGTQRWTMFPSDLDLTFGRNFGAGGGVLSDGIWADVDSISGLPNVSPSHPLFGDRYHQKYDSLWNRVIDAVLADPRFRAMHYRRTRTLVDALLAPGRYEARIAELDARIATEAEMDRVKWGQYGQAQTLAQATSLILEAYLPKRRNHLLVTHRVPGEIPAPQPSRPAVVINEIMYRPSAGADAEFVELFNPSASESVDLSGWRLQGVGLTLPYGTVLLPRDYLVVVKNDVMFRSTYGSGIFVAAQYNGNLDGLGERLMLLDRDGVTIDAVTFGSAAPWPAAADGGGSSLELIDDTRDHDRVANWSASVAAGGTPGAPNSTVGTLGALPDLYLNEVMPLNSAVKADEQGDYDPWIELYNAADATLDLAGLYVSDDFDVPDRWAFPADALLCGENRLLIWADGEASEGPLHTSFRLSPSGGALGLFMSDGTLVDFLNYGALPDGISYGRLPDGDPALLEFSTPTPGAANVGGTTAAILNEYNAVKSTGFLKDAGSDTYFGRVAGNGGNWFELVVTRDHLDMRGWRLAWTEDAGAGVLTLTNDGLWSDLRAGTILTFTEWDSAHGGADTEVSYAPVSGDWWINVNTLVGDPNLPPGDPGRTPQVTYVTTTTTVAGDGPGNFRVSNDHWQLTIEDAAGHAVFGPAGEGIAPEVGIGSDEVFKLEQTPGPSIHPHSDYNDGTSSTFGAPNRYAAGTLTQDFAGLRDVLEPCRSAADCNDSLDCTTDTCENDECRHTSLVPCYELLLNVTAGSPTGPTEWCGADDLTVTLDVRGLPQAINGVQVMLKYDPAHLTLNGIAPGDRAGSPWDAALEVAEVDNAGELTYAVMLLGGGTASDATVATLHFGVQPVAGATVVAFGPPCVPFRTKVTRSIDNLAVTPRTVDSGAVQWSECDDANPCTTDQCASGICAHQPLGDGTPCPDAAYCNGAELCSAGVCVPGVPVDCSYLNGDCVLGNCDEELQGCVGRPVGEGESCDDGQFCTVTDVCLAGLCVGSGDPCPSACQRCNEQTDACVWCRFDVTGDGTIGGGDFGLFAGCFGQCYSAPHTCLAYNFDGGANGCVGGSDFGLFSGCFGGFCGTCATCWGPPGLRGSAESEGWAAVALVPVAVPTAGDVVTELPAPVAALRRGEPFVVEVWAQGGRIVEGVEEGLAAVYVDVAYDASRLTPEGVLASGGFGLFAHGQVEGAAGVVRAVGGCAPLGERSLGTAGTWVRVASVRMRSRQAGMAALRATASTGPYGVAILNCFGDLEGAQLTLGTASVEIYARQLIPDSAIPVPYPAEVMPVPSPTDRRSGQ